MAQSLEDRAIFDCFSTSSRMVEGFNSASRRTTFLSREQRDGAIMDEKIETVARALCQFDGRDPDQVTSGPRPTGFQAFPSDPDGPPLWSAYKSEAERFIVAVEALLPLLDRRG